jgi:hypothetical protein
VQSVPAFITYAKANPGKINMGSAGSGTPQQIIGEMFKMMTGVDMVHVPYHGSAPELVDLIAGHVQVAFEPIQSCLGYIKAGRLRALAVSTARRAGPGDQPYAPVITAGQQPEAIMFDFVNPAGPSRRAVGRGGQTRLDCANTRARNTLTQQNHDR